MDDKILYERLKAKSDIPEEYFTYRLSSYDYYKHASKKPTKSKKKNVDKIDESEDKIIDKQKLKALHDIIKYCDNIENNFNDGRGLFIYGPSGSHLGITLLGTFVLRKALSQGKKCKFVDFPTFILNISSYSDEFKILQATEYYTTDFLMIDSINAFQYLNTSMVKTNFADLVFQRRKAKKPIIFSSHSDPDMLSLSYCDTLSNFIDSYCEKIDLSVHSIARMTLVEARTRIDNFARSDPGRDWQKYTVDEITKIISNH